MVRELIPQHELRRPLLGTAKERQISHDCFAVRERERIRPPLPEARRRDFAHEVYRLWERRKCEASLRRKREVHSLRNSSGRVGDAKESDFHIPVVRRSVRHVKQAEIEEAFVTHHVLFMK